MQILIADIAKYEGMVFCVWSFPHNQILTGMGESSQAAMDDACSKLKFGLESAHGYATGFINLKIENGRPHIRVYWSKNEDPLFHINNWKLTSD